MNLESHFPSFDCVLKVQGRVRWTRSVEHRGRLHNMSGFDFAHRPEIAGRGSDRLLKTLEGSDYVPHDCEGVFDDVPCPGNVFADWIEELADRDITGGCGGSNFCPASPNTRGQMAVFLTKTFGLLLYGP